MRKQGVSNSWRKLTILQDGNQGFTSAEPDSTSHNISFKSPERNFDDHQDYADSDGYNTGCDADSPTMRPPPPQKKQKVKLIGETTEKEGSNASFHEIKTQEERFLSLISSETCLSARSKR